MIINHWLMLLVNFNLKHMSNKILIPIFLVLIFSLVYNFIKIDTRMNLFKPQNSIYLLGIAASLSGIIFSIVIFRMNSIRKKLKNLKKQ